MIERRGRSEAQFLSVPVKHVITDVNPEFQDQFTVGGVSSLVRLFSMEQEGTGVLLGAETNHKRVGNIEHTFVVDKDGLAWEDIDIKSPGLVEQSRSDGLTLVVKSWLRKPETPRLSSAVWGHNDLRRAQISFKYQKILEQLGVRTYKSLFVAKLNEVFYKGKLVPVTKVPVVPKETRVEERNDALPEGFELAAEVRACRTKTRMQAVVERKIVTDTDKAEIRKEIDRARRLLCEEMSLHALTVEDYLGWFVSAYGRNLGVMHGAGLTHGFMNPGNVTLDCRILDLDSMGTFEESYLENSRLAAEYGTSISSEKSKEEDVQSDARTRSLEAFVNKVCAAYDLPIRTEVSETFMSAYRKAQERIPRDKQTISFAEKAQMD